MNHQDIINSCYFVDTYKLIEELKKDFPVNHGFVHIRNVMRYAESLAVLFLLSEHETELLRMAVALHDIGYTMGRKEHAKSGSILAREYLTKSDIDNVDIDVISNAIAHHGGKEVSDFDSKVSICLILADKLDFARNRYKDDISTYPQIAPYLEIISTEMIEQNNEIYLNVYVTSEFRVESLEDDYFNEKLINLLELLSQKINKPTHLNYIVK